MTWFRIDDKFHDHAKVRRLGKDRAAAVGVWTLCGSWSADTLSDGFVPAEIVVRFDPKQKLARRLVEVGLWTDAVREGEVGFQFHQWEQHQPTRADVHKRREDTRKRVEEWRKRNASHPQPVDDSDADGNALPDELVTPPPTRPDPTRPLSSGSFRGEGSVPARASAPPSRCKKHKNEPATGPCGPCADARKEHQRWLEADRAAVRACTLCTTDGQRIQPGTRATPMSPYVKCDHQPLPRKEPA